MPVNQNRFSLSADLLHPPLCLPDLIFQAIPAVQRKLYLLRKVSVGTNVILFQIDYGAGQSVDIVFFGPALVSFSLSGTQLGFNVDQNLNLLSRILGSGLLWNVNRPESDASSVASV